MPPDEGAERRCRAGGRATLDTCCAVLAVSILAGLAGDARRARRSAPPSAYFTRTAYSTAGASHQQRHMAATYGTACAIPAAADRRTKRHHGWRQPNVPRRGAAVWVGQPPRRRCCSTADPVMVLAGADRSVRLDVSPHHLTDGANDSTVAPRFSRSHILFSCGLSSVSPAPGHVRCRIYWRRRDGRLVFLSVMISASVSQHAATGHVTVPSSWPGNRFSHVTTSTSITVRVGKSAYITPEVLTACRLEISVGNLKRA